VLVAKNSDHALSLVDLLGERHETLQNESAITIESGARVIEECVGPLGLLMNPSSILGQRSASAASLNGAMSLTTVVGTSAAATAPEYDPFRFRSLAPELRVAMVTGATGVLGQATVRAFLAEGFRVVVHDNSVEDLNALVAQLGASATAEALYPICFDISRPEAVAAAMHRIQHDFGQVYFLINNNAVVSATHALDTTPEDWQYAFAQNVHSAFYMSREVLPAMRAKHFGRIINTCSLAGKTGGITTGIAYSTTKGALQTLTFSLARETARDGVTVNGISYAYVQTATLERFPKEVVDQLLSSIPVGRFMRPEEFAFAVLFLSSPMAGFITGEIVDLNGGLLTD
jgi:3-oxoacyl-[acyl-carrier protein] reductase